MDKRILLVEDEEDTREAVSEFLSEAGFQVTVAKDGEIAMELLRNNLYDMVVLDIMLPKVNGFVVLNWLRKRSQIPVLMLTAMHDEYTQLMSFDEQADDYITKPFSLRLLQKRMEALFRRVRPQNSTDIWQYQDIEVDFNGFQASIKKEPVDLKPKEILLLKLLLEHPNQVLTRDQILDCLWKDEAPMDRVIDVYIKKLRKKLHLDCIVTVKGIGYKYEDRL